ncbi:MAG TPA: hypothetical protein VFZ34_24750 [Blastocatellia bacterium]|nr:hypothetical protein [Blastocatellia bacterium]
MWKNFSNRFRLFRMMLDICVKELEASNKRSERTHAEIDRLQTETQANLAQIKILLDTKLER